MVANQHWTQVARRIWAMDRDEVIVRTRQEIAKRCDRLLCRLGVELVGRDRGGAAGARFFFSTEELPQILTILRERLPDTVEQILVQAGQICSHKFDLLGYERLDYGKEIDWHLDAVHGKRAPRRPWYQIRFLDYDRVGDSKVTWELNRHQHLVTLAKAYLLTGNTEYACELFQQWYHWHEQNPYGIGINWASSLEVAFRSLSWLWIWHLLRGSGCVPGRFAGDLRRALVLNSRHLQQFLSTYFSPNTHLLGEAVGLFFIGTLVSHSARLENCQKTGWEIILREAQRQVQADGMHFEQSTYYHVYALDFFLHSRILAGLNQVHVPAWFDHIIERMLKVVCILGAGGSLPRLGDDDGGRVFDPRRNLSPHLLDPLATGAVLYNRPEFKSLAGTLCEETVWLLGRDGVRRFDALRSARPAEKSCAFPTSGIYVMSSIHEPVEKLVVDAGPQGSGSAAHGHSDALSVQLSIAGDLVLIDPGTSTYARQAERDWFRGTASHNTIEVDGAGQAEPCGPFSWKALPTVSVDRWVTRPTFDFFAGWHSGFARLNLPARHRRMIFYAKPRFWLIRDVVEGAGRHGVQLGWHFAPGALTMTYPGARFIGKHDVAIWFAANRDFSCAIVDECYSPIYGRMEPSPTLVLGAGTELPFDIATALEPLPPGSVSTAAFRRLQESHTGVTGYLYASGNRSHYAFFADQPGTWHFDRWTSDAYFAFCSFEDGELAGFGGCDGSYFTIGGQRVFASLTQVPSFEWSASGDQSGTTPAYAEMVPYRSLPC